MILLPRSAAGHYESLLFPGPRLDPDALLRGDPAQVLAVAQQGLAAAGHAEFDRRLQEGRRPLHHG